MVKLHVFISVMIIQDYTNYYNNAYILIDTLVYDVGVAVSTVYLASKMFQFHSPLHVTALISYCVFFPA